MTKGILRIVTAAIFIFTALGIGALVLFPAQWNTKKNHEERQTRIVIPQDMSARTDDTDNTAEQMAREESITAKVPLEEGEVIVSVLNGNFDGNPMEEQFVAYRNLLEIESSIYLTFITYDEASREYKRVWSAPTAATRPGTISLYTQDLLGDRSTCVLLSGVNGQGEHTLTVFHMNSSRANSVRTNISQIRQNPPTSNELFSKIAELRIDGSINVREIERTQAYQMGLSQGQSFTIAAYGRDFESTNILDQVEIVYAYNAGNGLYEQTSRTRIPGTQIEQRRLRELLGNAQAFEDFVTGLWYYTTPQGTIDKGQYIYFDPVSREIIFYSDDTQQVFTWQNSTVTRYGLYVSSQNISVTTLRRSIDIELESLESIKVRVFEDVRLKIGVNAPWDGSYRKAGPPEINAQTPPPEGNAFINACYDSPMGKLYFFPDGSYEINAGGIVRQGKYSFFNIDDQEFLELRSPELRSADPRSEDTSGPLRETYLVGGETGKNNAAGNAPAENNTPGPQAGDSPDNKAPLQKTLTLLRVRIGSRGVEKLHEGTISLTLASEN